ncbi:hypothetical protein [Thaumasiovibrio sp. DFM-14]|uniref:hypothetical protein n=1 Tax=Thaumasiovibrio sp. DFM-14 TaxID=3384792 RepID=UPI0039A23D73
MISQTQLPKQAKAPQGAAAPHSVLLELNNFTDACNLYYPILKAAKDHVNLSRIMREDGEATLARKYLHEAGQLRCHAHSLRRAYLVLLGLRS